jgi:uncharacterized membrane protein
MTSFLLALGGLLIAVALGLGIYRMVLIIIRGSVR